MANSVALNKLLVRKSQRIITERIISYKQAVQTKL